SISDAATREEVWQRYLEQQEFSFTKRYDELVGSFLRFSGSCQLTLVNDTASKPPLSIHLRRDGKEILSLECDRQSSFATKDNMLFYAVFPRATTGCIVQAFDMTTGKKLWETEQLTGFPPFGHSAYGNRVTMNPDPGKPGDGPDWENALLVIGREDY